jgi:hypothetical protein
VADSLARFRRELADRNEARKKLQSIEADSTQNGDEASQQKKLSRQRSHVAKLEEAVHGLRSELTRDASQLRQSASRDRKEMEELEACHAAGKVGEASYRTEQYRLRLGIADAESRADLLEHASSAESAAEVRALETAAVTRPTDSESPEAAIQRFTEPRGMDWPGVTVPERIVMLWRESKKSSSRRSIIVSASVVAALTLILLGVVLVSGALEPRDAADYLGKGEVMVPVLIEDAEHLRNLEFTVAYDPDVLTGVSVVQDEVARLAVMQYDILKSGEVNIQVRDVVGINGSGSIVIIRFRTSEIVPEPSPLRLVSLSAVDVRTMMERPIEGEDGWVNTETLDVLAPVLRFPTS